MLFALLRSVPLPVETLESAQAFLDRYQPDWPGCLVLDLDLPGMNGLELQKELARRGVRIPIIFLSNCGDVPSAVRALQAGALDFLEKPFQTEAILASIRKALDREARARAEQARQADTAARLALLTPGEREVLDLMVAGLPYKAIARKLQIGYKAVEARRAKMIRKMQCDGLAELLVTVLSYRHWRASQPGAEGDPGAS
jgi:FixJ family two-component response regulator